MSRCCCMGFLTCTTARNCFCAKYQKFQSVPCLGILHMPSSRGPSFGMKIARRFNVNRLFEWVKKCVLSKFLQQRKGRAVLVMGSERK